MLYQTRTPTWLTMLLAHVIQLQVQVLESSFPIIQGQGLVPPSNPSTGPELPGEGQH